MDKKFTFFIAALMTASSLTVHAAGGAEVVPSKDWVKGHYFNLKNVSGNYLAIDSLNQDSVVVRSNLGDNKSAADLALWEISYAGTETTGNVYQFINKRTRRVLSFAKNINAEPVLATGVDKWAFSDNGTGPISAKLTSTQTMQFAVNAQGKLVFKGGEVSTFSVVNPKNDYQLTAKELGDGFLTFRLTFGEKIEGDIFSGKELIASTGVAGYIRLQEKGNEAYENGVKKYLGIDTLKIDGADKVGGVLGFSFSSDSIRTIVGKENEAFKSFKFTVDLKSDSLTMIVKSAPKSSTLDVRVGFVKLDDKKVLTVAEPISSSIIYPLITFKRGTPATVAAGTGVYFLKSASKGADGGKYIKSYDSKIVTMDGTPSVNQLGGQWYIKEEGGYYTIVSRFDDKTLLSKGEVFAVQGMADTYTFEGLPDSITLINQKVDFDNKYLGSLQLTKDQIANNGYALNLVPEESGAGLFVLTSGNDPVLKIKSTDIKDAKIFKILPSDTVEIGGAKSLGDIVSVIRYKLRSQFGNDSIALVKGKNQLQMSATEAALEFQFIYNAAGDKFSMEAVSSNKYVSVDFNTNDMILFENIAYYQLPSVEAPEYGTLTQSHKRFTSDAKSLTMNPFNKYAEMKQEGQDILKSAYERDHFSMWVVKSKASTADKPLYFITKSLAVDGIPDVESIRYYLVSGRDSSLFNDTDKKNPLVNFIKNDTIETMKESAKNPALFALKATESGNYLLENQKEVNSNSGTPYIGIINNVVVMAKSGIEFSVENAPVPTNTDEIKSNTFEVYANTGEVIVKNAAGKKITLSNVLGQTVVTRMATSDYMAIPATRGVIIVSVEGEGAQKVIVK